jgi:hypothetical protein
MDIGGANMFDKSVCFGCDTKMFTNINDMIDAINRNCDAIYFDRIPMMYEFNHITKHWEVYTTKEYQGVQV